MKMRVAHATLGRRRSEILGADIQPAGEALLAVDDEQLLVVAQIEKGHAPGQRRMEEARRLDAGPAQPPIGGSKEIPAADTVDQHARLDAARLGRGGPGAAADRREQRNPRRRYRRSARASRRRAPWPRRAPR